jgi:hypothetical protein
MGLPKVVSDMIDAAACCGTDGSGDSEMSKQARFLVYVIASVLACSVAVAQRAITKDSLIATDPHWGRDEVKKIDSCLRLPNSIKRSDIGRSVIGIEFTIDTNGKISKLKADPYHSQSRLRRASVLTIQDAMIEAVRCSKIRGPMLPDPPFRAMYFLTDKKSGLSLIAPASHRNR